MTDLKDLIDEANATTSFGDHTSIADAFKISPPPSYAQDSNNILKRYKESTPTFDDFKDTNSLIDEAFGMPNSVADTFKKSNDPFSHGSYLQRLNEAVQINDPYKGINKRLCLLHDSLNADDPFNIASLELPDDEAYSPSASISPPIQSNETYAIERARETAKETNNKIRQLIEIQIETNKANEQANYKNRTLGLQTFFVVVAGLLLAGLIGYGTGKDNQNWQKKQEINSAKQTQILREIRDQQATSKK